MSSSEVSRRSRLGVENLETRETPAQFGNPWADPTHLTLSFARDGVSVLGVHSSLQASLARTWSSNIWHQAVLRAVQAWSEVANVSVGVVGDGGQAFGASGPVQSDPRFGDIRVGGIPMGGDALAATVPPDPFVSGTLAGDIFFNTRTRFTFKSLYGVALHEVGHALGLAPSSDPTSVMFNTFNQNLALSASDRAAIQAMYGVRAPDANEGSNGNNVIARATEIHEPGSYDGQTPLVIFGDISTRRDVDVFEVRNQNDYSGAVTFHLQSRGVSLLAGRLTILDSAGHVLASRAGTGASGSALSITLTTTVPAERYFVVVRAAGGSFTPVGRYGLGVTFDGLVKPTATPLAAVLRGPFDTLKPDEIAALFEDPNGAIYGDDGGTNDDASHASNLPEDGGFPLGTHFSITASLATAADVDQYVVRAPQTANDLAVLTATVRAVGPNGSTPRIQVFDSNQNPIQSTIVVNDNATFTIQAANIPANKDYILRVANAAHPGNYALDVSFLLHAVSVQTLSAGSVNVGAQVSSTLYIGRSQAFGLALSATGPAGATVQLSIADSAGRTVFTLNGQTGDTVTGPTTLLAPGQYTLKLTAAGSGGTVNFSIDGEVITDPIGPQP
ncbi:MAG TPA: matrixin family metalloprotease, partial [Gemmata sp.]|nr:matrixin family metalloprotease [Gemmata sp.]